ncbi:hypothetical protein VTI74DRAFT_11586 [Chaetomium olivicolor]
MYERANEIDRRNYNRLGRHPNLASVVKIDEHDIWHTRAEHGCTHGVRHADLTGRDLLLDAARNILLCDFAASYIDGEEALVIAEAGYPHPDRSEYLLPTMRSEIHSLGSTFYEIVTGKQPHHGLEDREIELLLRRGCIPICPDSPSNQRGGVVSKKRTRQHNGLA